MALNRGGRVLRGLKQWLEAERTPSVNKYYYNSSTAAPARRHNRESDDEDTTVEVRKRHPSSSSSPDPSAYRSSSSGLLSDTMSPFQTATSLFKMMDTMDRLFESPFSPFFTTNGMGRSGYQPNKHLRTPWDVMADEKAFKLRMDMPGLAKEDVKVRVEDGTLIIQGEKSSSSESLKDEEEEGWSGSRSSYGKYETRILLPENVKMGEVKATLKNGVLFVIAPKEDEGLKKELYNVQVN